MEDLKTEIEQIKVQISTGIKLGRIEKVWGEMIVETCDKALAIPADVEGACDDYVEGINMQCSKCDHPKYKHLNS